MSAMRTLRRLAVAVIGLVTLVAAVPSSSSLRFHTRLIKSEPAANDTLTAAPHALRLWFSERVELPVTTVKLTDNDGAPVALAEPVRPDTGQVVPIIFDVKGTLSAGTYLVTWSTAAKDGHPAKGTYTFVVKAKH